VTFNTKYGVSFFANKKYAELLSNIIIKAAAINKFYIYAFCILPNHVHLMIKSNPSPRQASVTALKPRAGTEACTWDIKTILGLIHSIKSFFCQELRHKYGVRCSPWQPRFNSRIVNTDRRFENTYNYIINNYRKHRLPNKYSQRPYIFNNRLF
jgi:REP element-mobilizing transposase RayT